MFSAHHISMSVSNADKSLAFYEQLGFEKVYEWQAEDLSLKILHLRLGEIVLEIFNYPSPQEAPRSTQTLATDLKRIGIKHFALKVTDIGAAKEKLQALDFIGDVEINRGNTGIDYFFIKDPDGIFIEIVQDDRNI